MKINKAVGRQQKVTMRTVVLLADAIAHNTNITDSCRFVGISRSSFYYYLKNNQVFAERMATAKENQSKFTMNFWTIT
jgi:ACT domain-containing protein